MARGRVKLSPTFEYDVSEAVSGELPEVTARFGARRDERRRVTLKDLAEAIAEEAQSIIDMPVRKRRQGEPPRIVRNRAGLPYRMGKTGQDFRRSHSGMRYRSSFRTDVERSGNRWSAVVTSRHQSSRRIEDGSGDGGPVLDGPGWRKIPITHAAYARMNKKLSLSQQRAKGWGSADKEYRKWYARNRRAIIDPKHDIRAQKKSISARGSDIGARMDSRSSIPRSMVYQSSRQGRNFGGYGRARTKKGVQKFERRGFSTTKIARRTRYIAKINGQPYLMVKTFRTYTRYDILQRAMRNIAITHLR